MSKNNFYTYLSLPNEDERKKIRNEYLDFQFLRISNTALLTPISINPLYPDAISDAIFYNYNVFNYSCAINDELLAIDYSFLSLVHLYNKAEKDIDNRVMYRPFLKLYVEIYVSKLVSLCEKIIISIINITDNNKRLEPDDMKKYSSRKHEEVMNNLKQYYQNYSTLEALCTAINNLRTVLNNSGFEKIRNDAQHNFSEFDLTFHYESGKHFLKIKGPSAKSSYRKVIEEKMIYDKLTSLLKCYEVFLIEVVEKYRYDL